ncbi:hypothetical protein EON76_04390 [bacterium]|nr:MAG: hypothetical protein EON76_04390 [bacterium]
MPKLPSPNKLLINRITQKRQYIEDELEKSLETSGTYLPRVSENTRESLVFYAHQLHNILTPNAGIGMNPKMNEAIFFAAKVAETAGSEFISPGPRQNDRRSSHIEGIDLASKIMDVNEKYLDHFPLLELIAMTAFERIGLDQNYDGLVRATKHTLPLHMMSYYLIGTESENQKLYLAEQSFARS